MNKCSEILEKYKSLLESETFTPPESVAKEAQKALDFKDKYGDEVNAGTQVGWIRANQLAKKEKVSLDTIERMKSFFARHQGNEKISPDNKGTPWKDNGYVSWLLWGGDSGKEWVNNILDSEK